MPISNKRRYRKALNLATGNECTAQQLSLKPVQRQKNHLLTHKGNVVLYIAFFFALLQLPNIALRAGANTLVTNFHR